MKQTPPLARDVQALHETLRGTSATFASCLLRQWLRRYTYQRQGTRPLEIRPHRASAKKGGDRGDAMHERRRRTTMFDLLGWRRMRSGFSTGCRRRENRSISTGNTTRIRNGARRLPPTTTIASGFCTCEPMPVDKAAGRRPTQATMQVIATGRICTAQVRKMAALRSIPPLFAG